MRFVCFAAAGVVVVAAVVIVMGVLSIFTFQFCDSVALKLLSPCLIAGWHLNRAGGCTRPAACTIAYECNVTYFDKIALMLFIRRNSTKIVRFR